MSDVPEESKPPNQRKRIAWFVVGGVLLVNIVVFGIFAIGTAADSDRTNNNQARAVAANYSGTPISPSSIYTPPRTTVAQATTTTAPTPGKSKWSGNGVFSVGSTPTGGAKAAIPPGRYTIEMTDSRLGALVVIRCSDLPCSETQNFLGGDSGFGDSYVSVIEILPSDGAVRLMNATLTAVP
ncbi:hypothetical protein [Nocardia sp. SC052]|uniref:hypothetical protein n=1 Tax=Nocardia sichangensis TaxID=3385975 RepID=UPI0039A29411